jgi:hypothetical protein
MEKKIGLIFNGVWSHYAFANALKYKHLYELVYVHNLDDEAVKDFSALVIPFQSNQEVLTRRKSVIYNFLNGGKKVFIEGDSTPEWLDAQWETRPVNNYWWVTDPENPPVAVTNYDHPIYQGLKPRHACWHTHGVYTRIPEGACVIQTNQIGDIVSWETNKYGGTLFATTLDPIVEQGIQQITHLDNYCDKLTFWLCGEMPEGKFTIDKNDYGIEI